VVTGRRLFLLVMPNSLFVFRNTFGARQTFDNHRLKLYKTAMKHLTAANVRWIRRRLGMTQQELADAVGCQRAMVSWWELGRHSPRGANRRALLGLYEKVQGKGKQQRGRK
jgi:DNA-binding transcriptional regulator YiaG